MIAMPAADSRKYETDFKWLFDGYKNQVHCCVLALTHSAYIAEEITQEIFIRHLICRHMLDDLNNLEGYLASMARNKSLNYLRQSAHDAAESEVLSDLKYFSFYEDLYRYCFREHDKLYI